MPSTSSRLNEKIPFDVLGLIFSHYAVEETIHYPLETLLLVCRGWKEAALGHCALWNELNIYLGHNPTSQIWNIRLPLRLARSGPVIPLYIKLRNYLAIPLSERTQGDALNDKIYFPEPCTPVFVSVFRRCVCFTAAMKCAEISLRMLMGKNGELCPRWRSFELSMGLFGAEFVDGQMVHNLQEFNQATNLRELSLFLTYPVDINLPLRLDRLTRLHLRGQFSIDLLGRDCETPRLAELTIEFLRRDLLPLVQRKQFHQSLHQLTLLWDAASYVSHEFLLKLAASVLKLVSLCSQLDTLSMNRKFLGIFFRGLRKLPIESFQSSMRGKWLVNAETGSSYLFDRSQGPRSLEQIALVLGAV